MAKKRTGARGRGKASGIRGSGRGAGRREEGRGSGTYPEPLGSAPPDAAIRTPAEWGQAERRVEGYEDSGRSELTHSVEEAEAYQREATERRSGEDRRASQPEPERTQE